MGWHNLDISRLKAAEDALRNADRRKSEFLAVLAHELRNPLNPIRSAVEVLRGRATPKQQAWARDVIDRQLDHLCRLIDDLMDLSRVSRGRLELRRRRLELKAVLRGAVEAARPAIARRHHRLEVELPAEDVWLEADTLRLMQVLLNLLDNAAKYTEPGGVVSLSVRTEEDAVSISVRDTGIGIAPEHVDHLFELFFQADRSLERGAGGLGIGLSLVRDLVSMHGGSVTARSAGRGRGSEFVVRLPRATAPETTTSLPPPARAASTAPAFEALRVLVVDDNADSAQSLALVLELAGHHAEVAADGEAGLGRAEALRPDVLLLDIGMPRMNGFDVCRRIRAQPWGAAVIMIAQTGWGQEEDRQRTREAGFDAHLVKPVDAARLLALIAELRAVRSGQAQSPVDATRTPVTGEPSGG